MQQLRQHGDDLFSAQRAACAFNARPVVNQTPAQRAFELIARIEVAKQHKDRAAFDAAKAELATLIERL